MYRPWMAAAPAGLEVCPVQLPGRETRVAEPAFTGLDPLLDALEEALPPYLDIPFALFGHSMGALIAFEFARRLHGRGGPQPVHLFVSGLRGPHLPDPDPPIYQLPDAEFLAEVRRLNGTPDEVLQHPELMQLLLPILRADLTICDTYVHAAGEPLSCPISALGGLEDPKASPDELEAWSQHTTAGFRKRMFAGDHFYLVPAQAQLVQAVAADLHLTSKS
jgi:medium-chain acyl-[acyl-carrier-protein] hydrolase